jgi:hypothetical protein
MDTSLPPERFYHNGSRPWKHVRRPESKTFREQFVTHHKTIQTYHEIPIPNILVAATATQVWFCREPTNLKKCFGKLCLTTDWTTWFRSPSDANSFSCNRCVQISSEAHPASYPKGTGGSFLGIKRGRGVRLTTHPHLLLKSRKNRSYISSPLGAFMGVIGQFYFYLTWCSDTHLNLNYSSRKKKLLLTSTWGRHSQPPKFHNKVQPVS